MSTNRRQLQSIFNANLKETFLPDKADACTNYQINCSGYSTRNNYAWICMDMHNNAHDAMEAENVEKMELIWASLDGLCGSF